MYFTKVYFLALTITSKYINTNSDFEKSSQVFLQVFNKTWGEYTEVFRTSDMA